jgi:phospholipid N-methyltransferase
MNENKKPFGYGLAEYTQGLVETERANELMTESPTGAGDGQGFGGDVVDSVQYGLAQAVGGLAETGHQLTGSESLADIRDASTDWGRSQLEEMSPEGREAMTAPIFQETAPDFEGNTSLEFGEGATNWKTWALQLSSLTGQMVPQIALGGGFASLGAKAAGSIVMRTAAKKALASGATKEASILAGKKAAEATFIAARGKAGVASFAVVGTAIAGGMIGNEVRDEVLSMTDAQLDESNEFRKLYYQIKDMQPELDTGGIRDLTKRTLADRTATTVEADPMLITSNLAMEAVGGKFLDNLVRGIGTGSRLSNASQQFAVQGVTESAQGGIEKYASNSAIIEEGVDPNRDAFEGVKGAAANEGILGGVLGGGMGAIRSGQPATDSEQQPIDAEQYSEDGEQKMNPIQQDPLVAEELSEANQSDLSSDEATAQMNPERGKYRGIDDDILIAEKQGFSDEAVRLRTAKRNFEMAQDFLGEGDQVSANRFRERGLKIYRDVMEPNSPDNHESSNLFPAEYAATGEVLQKENMPAVTEPLQGETIEAQRPADISQQLDNPAERLAHEDIIYAGRDTAEIDAAKAKTDIAFMSQHTEKPKVEPESVVEAEIEPEPSIPMLDHDNTIYAERDNTERDAARAKTEAAFTQQQGSEPGAFNYDEVQQDKDQALNRLTEVIADIKKTNVQDVHIKGERGRKGRVKVGDNYQPVTFKLVDMNENPALKPTMGRAKNQFRDRNRAASNTQIASIAANLDFNELGESPRMTSGAPTLSREGRVIGGNGRMAAIRKAYSKNSAEQYKSELKKRAAEFGIKPEAIDKMKSPVLIRQFDNPVDVAKAAIESNNSGTMDMSALEQASADNELIPNVPDLEMNADGNINWVSESNRRSLRGFISALPQSSQNSLLKSDGTISPSGIKRFENLLMYKAFGQNQVLDNLIENAKEESSQNIKNVLQSLAPQIAMVRQGMSRGDYHNLDITDHLVEAIELLESLRASSRSVSDYMAQLDMVSVTDPVTNAIAQELEENVRSTKALREQIKRYYDLIINAGHPDQSDMFGESSVNINDLVGINNAERKNDESDAGQAGSSVERSPVSKGKQSSNDSGRAEAKPTTEESDASTDEELLTSYTEDDLSELEATNKKAADEKTKTEKAAGNKAKADSEANDFVLAGSNSDADQAEARGQNNLFDAQSSDAPITINTPLYHGTSSEFSEFSLEYYGDASGSGDLGEGVYFTNKKSDAKSFATDAGDAPIVKEVRLKSANLVDGNKLMQSQEFQDSLDSMFKDPRDFVGDADGIYYYHKESDSTEVVIFEPAIINIIDQGSPLDTSAKVDQAASEAATSPSNNTPEPTEAQQEAGNYKKGHVSIQGLDIAIENARDSERKGTDPDGNKWSVKMAHNYGYIKNTEGADGDHVDVFVGKYPDSEKVFIVDQVNPDGSFDEHKVMLGFKNKAMAITGYKASYEKGWKVGPIKTMTMTDFKEWLKSGNTKKPSATFTTEGPELGSKDTFTNYNAVDSKGQPTEQSFERGEYAKAVKSEKEKTFFKGGIIKGVSESKQQAKINGQWFDFGTIVKAEKPSEYSAPTTKASKVIESANKKTGEGLTDADKVDGPVIDYATNAIEGFNQFRELTSDAKATKQDIQSSFDNLTENKEAVLTQLNKLTKDGLLRYVGRKDLKKPAMVDSAYKTMMSAHVFGDAVMTIFGGNKTYDQQIAEKVAAQTQEQIETEYDRQRVTRAERQKLKESFVKSLTNPETLAEYKEFIRVRGKGKLSTEQLKNYDTLVADTMLEEEKAKPKVVQGETETVETTRAQTTHSKHGHDLFVVSMVNRVSKEQYKDLNGKAKELGGYYSAYSKDGAISGFQFKTIEEADQFEQVLQGSDVDRGDSEEASAENKNVRQADKLTDMGEKLEAKGNESLAQPRQTNTGKRAAEAASASAKAYKQIAIAQTVKQIATKLAAGEVVYLGKMTQITQLEELKAIQRSAVPSSMMHSEYDGYSISNSLKDGVVLEDYINNVRMPELFIGKENAQRFSDKFDGVKGFSRFAAELQKLPMAEGKKHLGRLTKDQVQKLHDAVKAGHISSYELGFIPDREKTVNRLDKLGIKTDEQLRTAIRELDSLTVAEQKEDPIKKLERDLIGKKIDGYFPTPRELVEQMLEYADIQAGHQVLEPSAGKGNIADVIKESEPGADIDVIEINSGLRSMLKQKGYNVVSNDFIDYSGKKYDRIVMNPPFENFQDIDHVMYAYEMLKPGGKLVAIMGAGVKNSRKKAVEFRQWIEEAGSYIEDLPEGSFKSSERQTGVATVMVAIEKPSSDGVLFSLPKKGIEEAIKDMKETLQRTEDSDKKKPATESAFSSVDDVKSWIAETEKYLGKKVNVVASKMDLPIAVKFRVGVAGFGKDFDAIFDQETGETWINANQIADKEHAIKTVLHETLGHGGVIDFLHEQEVNGGKEVTDALDDIYRRAGRKLINRDIGRYDFDYSKPKQRQTAVLEYIAHLAETGKKANWMHKVLGAIKNAMRKIFPNLSWTDLDTLLLLEKGRRHLRENGSEGSGSETKANSSSLMRLSDAIENDSNLSDEQKAFLDKIGPKSLSQTVVERLSEVMNRGRLKIRQGMVDRFAALLEMDKKLLGGNATGEDNITSSSWVRARMSNGASGAVSAMMSAGRVYLDTAEGVIDVKQDTNGLVHALNKLGGAAEVEKFFGWIAANRAEKLAAEGRENLFTAEDIAAGKILNQGALQDGRNRGEVYDQVFVEFQQHRDDILAIAEKSGVITAENREMWANEFYVPFYRIMEDEDSVQGAKTMGGLTRQQAYKKLKGGSQNVNDLLQNTIMNFHHLVDASLKNLAAKQAMDNALELEVASETNEHAKSKQATFVLRDGQKVWYDIHDELVFQSLTALNSTGMNGTAMKTMRWFKRIFTNMTTSTPQFLVANLLRDSLSSMAVADLKFNPVGNVASGIKSFGLLDKTKYERARLLATGGAFSFGHVYGEDADSIRYYIDGEMRRADIVKDPAGLLKHGLKPVQAAWDKWQDVSNGFENANRMAAFKQAEAAGKGKLYAAHQSRDMMDFSGIGAWPAVRFLVDVVPFLNARLQGLDKLYRAGVKPTTKVVMNALGVGDVNASLSEKKAAARFMSVVGALSMATMALYLHNKDDEEYQKLPDWMKDSYWWYRIPGTNHALTGPKPFEVGAIATLVERLLEQAVDDKATGKLFAERLGHMLSSTFAFNPIPQMIQPTMDVYANKDSFTGRQIETMGQQRLSPSKRVTDRTTAAAELLGNGMEAVLGADSSYTLSPIQIDYLIGGYFGQVGAWAVGHADVLRNTLSDNERPARHWYEYQPVRRFYKNLEDPHHDKQQTLFYEALRNSSRTYADLQQLRTDKDIDGVAELKADNKDLLSIRKRLNRAARRISSINSRIKRVKANSSLGSDEKRREIDLLKVRKNALVEKTKRLTDELPL